MDEGNGFLLGRLFRKTTRCLLRPATDRANRSIHFNLRFVPAAGIGQQGVEEAVTTRDQRIGEYVAVRRRPVVGIEEETALLVQGDRIEVVGSGRVKVFDLAGTSRWYAPGDLLPFGACEESPS